MTTHKVITTINGVDYETKLEHEGELSAIIKGILGKGCSELLRDAGSTTSGSQQKKDEAIRARIEKFHNGTYVFGGGGGGGATLSPEIRAEIVWVKMGLSGKAIAKVNGKTVAEHLLGKLRAEVYNLTEEGEERTTMLKALPDLFPDWRVQNRKDDVVLAGLIEAEKALDEAKQKTASVSGGSLRAMLLAKAAKAENTVEPTGDETETEV